MSQFISQFELFSMAGTPITSLSLSWMVIQCLRIQTTDVNYYQHIKISQQQTTSRTYLAAVTKVGFGTVFSNVSMETMRLSIISEELT